MGEIKDQGRIEKMVETKKMLNKKKSKRKRINEKETNEERLPPCRSRAMWDMYLTGRGGGGSVLSTRDLPFVSAPTFVTRCSGIRRELL